MINAALSLLVNLDGNGVDLTPFGLYTDPGYRAVPLPPALGAVSAALFNNSTDRILRDYFAMLYLTVLHSSDFEDHLLALDPRITYWPFDASTTPGFGIAAIPINHTHPLYLSGPQAAAPGATTMLRSWTATVQDASDLLIQSGAASATAALAFADGLSQPVPLPQSTIQVRVAQGLPPGTSWTVESLLQPAEGLPEVFARILGLHAESLVALFGVLPAEPFLSYRNLFQDADQLQDRLAGVLLALIRQTYLLQNPA